MSFILFISEHCPPRHSSCSDALSPEHLNLAFCFVCPLLTSSKQCQWLSLLALRFFQHCCITSQKTDILGLTFFNIPLFLSLSLSLSHSLCFRNLSPSMHFFTFSILVIGLRVYTYSLVYPPYFTLPCFVQGGQILQFMFATPLAVSNQNC